MTQGRQQSEQFDKSSPQNPVTRLAKITQNRHFKMLEINLRHAKPDKLLFEKDYRNLERWDPCIFRPEGMPPATYLSLSLALPSSRLPLGGSVRAGRAVKGSSFTSVGIRPGEEQEAENPGTVGHGSDPSSKRTGKGAVAASPRRGRSRPNARPCTYTDLETHTRS